MKRSLHVYDEIKVQPPAVAFVMTGVISTAVVAGETYQGALTLVLASAIMRIAVVVIVMATTLFVAWLTAHETRMGLRVLRAVLCGVLLGIATGVTFGFWWTAIQNAPA